MISLRHVAAGLLAAALTACGGGGGSSQSYVPPPLNPSGSLYYSYPDQGQTRVSVHAPIVLSFSDPVTNASEQTVWLEGAGQRIATDLTLADEGRSVVLRPRQPLSWNQGYQVRTRDLRNQAGAFVVPEQGIRFRTRTAQEGPRSQRVEGDALTLTRLFPDGDTLPLVDISSLRMQFSQPLDEASVTYGGTVRLQRSNGQLVPASLLVQGNVLTVDPIDDLQPGQRHVLVLGRELRSLYGQTLQAPFQGSHQFEFVPGDTRPRATLVLQVPEDGRRSMLTGEPINLVPVVSTLLGDATASQQGGNVYNELAYIPRYEEAVPLRLSRGSLMEGGSLQVLIGGQVPAGFESGPVRVQFISDASGYLLPNHYSPDDPRAPKLLHMFMDVAILTEDARANGAFNQNILHLELVGRAKVEEGMMVADAVTVVENSVMGLEYARGVLSFRMESYEDQINAPPRIEDRTPPVIRAWQPGDARFTDRSQYFRPHDPIVIQFDEPLDPASVAGQVTLTESGRTVRAGVRVDGTSLVIDAPTTYGKTYELELGSGLTDLAGNRFVGDRLSFTVPAVADPRAASPMVLTTYPGFPCPTAGINLRQRSVGRCLGTQATDDQLLLPDLPANRHIQVRFSQPMMEQTFQLGASVQVERVDENGQPLGTVPGRLHRQTRDLHFIPDQPWQEGALYRYVLRSNGDSHRSHCDPGPMICGANGLPLRTRVFALKAEDAPAIDGGGPDLVIHFRGAAPVPWVLQSLSNYPSADVDTNGIWDAHEPGALDDPLLRKNSTQLELVGTGGAIADAELGCAIGQQCPENRFIYMNQGMLSDIVGHVPPEQVLDLDPLAPPDVRRQGGILVWLYPTVIQTTQLEVHAKAALGTADPAPTGPMYMRMRARCDARGSAKAPKPAHSEPLPACTDRDNGLVPGWIVETATGPQFVNSQNLYMDSPSLKPMVKVIGIPSELTHNQRSYGFPLQLRGDLTFFDDGRLQIEQHNEVAVPMKVAMKALGLLDAEVRLNIPVNGIYLNYLSDSARR